MNKPSIERLKVRAYNLMRFIDKARTELQQVNVLVEQLEQEDKTESDSSDNQALECTS